MDSWRDFEEPVREFIIVIDGSDDGTREYLDSSEIPRAQVIHLDSNTCYADAANLVRLWHLASTSCFLNNDLVLTRKLARANVRRGQQNSQGRSDRLCSIKSLFPTC